MRLMCEIFELSQETTLEGLLECEFACGASAWPDLYRRLLQGLLADQASFVRFLYLFANVHHHLDQHIFSII